MATKKKEEVEVVETVQEKVLISEINHDFGRDDLNELRDKINELIRTR